MSCCPLHLGVLDALNNSYGIATLWIALAFVASVISVRIGLVGRARRDPARRPRRQPLRDVVEPVDRLPRRIRLGAADLSRRRGDRSEVLPAVPQAQSRDRWHRFHRAVPARPGDSHLLVLHWPMHGSEIAGIALSTTSVAVVYAVMLDTGLNKTDLGKLILCACFVCDLGTVLALGLVFANYNSMLIAFGIATAIVMVFLPRSLRFVIRHFGHPISEPEVKYVFLLLFGLGALATAAKSEAVLPAYLLGLGAAGIFHQDPKMVGRVRGVAFTFLTPFFFLRAGTLIALARRDRREPHDCCAVRGQGRGEGDRCVSGDASIPDPGPRGLVHDDDDVDRASRSAPSPRSSGTPTATSIARSTRSSSRSWCSPRSCPR